MQFALVLTQHNTGQQHCDTQSGYACKGQALWYEQACELSAARNCAQAMLATHTGASRSESGDALELHDAHMYCISAHSSLAIVSR